MNRKILLAYIGTTRPILVLGSIFYLSLGIILADIKCTDINLWLLYLTSIFITASVYSFNWWTDFIEDNLNETLPYLTKRYIQPKKVILLSLFSLVLASIFGFYLRPYILAIVWTIFCLGIVYSYPMFKNLRLKNILGAKNVVIACGWSLGAIMPLMLVEAFSRYPILILWLFVFLQVFIGSVIRDIKDMKGDIRANVKTFPTMWKRKKVYNFLHAVNIFSVFLLFFAVYFKLVPLFFISLTIGNIWRYFNIEYTYKKNKYINFIYEEMNIYTGLIFAVSFLMGKYLL
ncbi:hypothetical protein DRN74_03835 [Candidatus Micrarchaeota archaeon]|nr:MAG: hypothetical protein DRN74_03835 [Candidatus Micrarchaeota archaeon]